MVFLIDFYTIFLESIKVFSQIMLHKTSTTRYSMWRRTEEHLFALQLKKDSERRLRSGYEGQGAAELSHQ